MPYGPQWDASRAAQVIAEAEGRWRHTDTSLGFLYRFEETRYSVVIDAEREEYGTSVKLELYAYPIVKKTPCGHTILINSGGILERRTRFVNESSTKQFACRNIAGAKRSFCARKAKQAKIYEAKAKYARYLIAVAKNPGPPYLSGFGTGSVQAMSPETVYWRGRALAAEAELKRVNQAVYNMGWEMENHRAAAQRQRDHEIGLMGGGG